MNPQAHLRESAKPLARTEKLVVQDLVNEILIYDLDENKAFTLNHTSKLVWQNCDGKNSIRDIAHTLQNTLRQPVSEELVWLALDGLEIQNLIEFETADLSAFRKLDRRQLAKKIGLASMVALPFIGALSAPHAASAASLNCSVCSKKTAADCAVCDALGNLGRCQLNSGCGQGQNAGQTSCTACFIQNNSNPGGVSWGGP